MLSHVVKKLLDDVTGLSFRPVHDSEAFYILKPLERGVINRDALEVRIISSDFDNLEVLRANVECLISFNKDNNRLVDDYSLRFALSGGGILPLHDFNLYDSSQFLTVTWFKKER
ncbi:hypothetical protein [Gemella sp. zg-1178]|uniref:hypothetical protein n=1 Tax=Gemella sp. zg-1178 TaxID=2840372 RepID=UPI001C04B598|nr:hypothetical protein [Gemella sp. zg-1178]MBU0279210.1 hypothetical protein [Gemella sp. zg-1178]